jgi:hypothetical protein
MDIYIFQCGMSVDPSVASSRTSLNYKVRLCAVSADGVGEDFPIEEDLSLSSPVASGPSKQAIKTAITNWASGKGHTAKKIVYADMSMDSL